MVSQQHASCLAHGSVLQSSELRTLGLLSYCLLPSLLGELGLAFRRLSAKAKVPFRPSSWRLRFSHHIKHFISSSELFLFELLPLSFNVSIELLFIPFSDA